jgi:hypothetical protein
MHKLCAIMINPNLSAPVSTGNADPREAFFTANRFPDGITAECGGVL